MTAPFDVSDSAAPTVSSSPRQSPRGLTRATTVALVAALAAGLCAGCKATPESSPDAAAASPTGPAAAAQPMGADGATGPTGTQAADTASAATGSTGAAAATGPEARGMAPKSNGLASGPASPEIVAAARAIQAKLECLRGKTFQKDPAVAFQSLDDFRTYVNKQVRKELGGAKGAQLVRMLHALDVVDPSVDVIAMLVEAAVGQAAAYYDPETNTFYVVQEMPAMMLNSVMAHELQHALQDQHTDLLDEYLDAGFGTTDKDLATRFIVEGEATLIGHTCLVEDTQSRLLGDRGVSVCHLPGRQSGEVAQFWPLMRGVVAEAAAQTRDDVLNPGLLTRLAANSMMSEGMAKSMKQLEKLPVYFFYTLLLPYNQGGLTVYEHFADAGFDWTKVDALFTEPPETTEQVLHPEKLGPREAFAKLSLAEVPPQPAAAAEGWASDPPDRLGELLLRILLIEEGVDERSAVSAAAGWNGDAIRVWHRGDLLAFDWKIAWDAEGELHELLAVLPSVLETQRGDSLRGLDGFDPQATTAHWPFSWTDSQGRARHGALHWEGRELRWTDGWTQAVDTIPGAS